MECQYDLMAFGVPVESLPLTEERQVKKTVHNKWIAKRKIKEQMNMYGSPYDRIDLPSRQDVLIGKGKPFQDSS